MSMNDTDKHQWSGFLAVGMGTFFLILDQSAVNIALPQISTYFHVKISDVQWVVIG